MSFAGKRNDFSPRDLVEVGARFDLNRDGRDIVEEVVGALQQWPDFARAAGVPDGKITAIGEQFRIA